MEYLCTFGLFIIRRNISLLCSLSLLLHLSPSLPPTNSFCPWQGPVCVVTLDTPCAAASVTPGDRHLKPARSQLDKVWDIVDPGRAEREGERSGGQWCRGGGWEGSQEVCKDSSALSRHYNRLWLYRRLPPEGVFQLQLIKSPWARCLGQVFKHKGKSIPPLGLFLADATALISPLVALIWRRGQILLVSASSVNGQMSRSHNGARNCQAPCIVHGSCTAR